MNTIGQPHFLEGTFAWSELGYFYSDDPPRDLLSAEALRSNEPWIVLAAILENAKAGNWQPLSILEKLIRIDYPTSLLTVAALELLADAGGKRELQILESILLTDYNDDLLQSTAEAATYAGVLALGDSLLSAWTRATANRNYLKNSIVRLLEGSYGAIGTFAGNDPAEFVHLVKTRLEELNRQMSKATPIIEGRVFGVVSHAQYMQEFAKSADRSWNPLFYFYRHKFEAATGIDCSSFYKDHELQRLAVSAIVEEFLQSPEAANYELGVRYFFGHRIPD